MACIYGGSTWFNKALKALQTVGVPTLKGLPIKIVTPDVPTDLTLPANGQLICMLDSIPVYKLSTATADKLTCTLPAGTDTEITCVMSS